MSSIRNLVIRMSQKARDQRAQVFRRSFYIGPETRILDLGSEDGSNIRNLLEETEIRAENVHIADIEKDAVNRGSQRFGYNPVFIGESGKLPFEDDFFDIVFCSSVIEHVTVPKEEVWKLYSGRLFRSKSLARQKEFVDEIRRLGKQYFVQTPYKHFPIESHSWLPFVAWLPRWILILVLRFTNLFWVKKTSPDWYLLNMQEMHGFFPDAKIVKERKFGLTKSLMAISTHSDLE